MNTKTFFSLLLASSLVLTSCKKELEPQESTPSSEVTPATGTTAATNPATPGTPMQMPQATTSTTTAPPVATAPGMNPPHGQAGHRCDISVGAPLNSPPGKPATPPAQPQMTTKITQSGNTGTTITPAIINADGNFTTTPAPSAAPPILQAPVETAPGMNPPHGQEGHVCGTAVGAPLPK